MGSGWFFVHELPLTYVHVCLVIRSVSAVKVKFRNLSSDVENNYTLLLLYVPQIETSQNPLLVSISKTQSQERGNQIPSRDLGQWVSPILCAYPMWESLDCGFSELTRAKS